MGCSAVLAPLMVLVLAPIIEGLRYPATMPLPILILVGVALFVVLTAVILLVGPERLMAEFLLFGAKQSPTFAGNLARASGCGNVVVLLITLSLVLVGSCAAR